MRVSVPASSANLGPGFDTLGIALNLPFVASTEPEDGLLLAGERHPLMVAYRAANGAGSLWWRSPIPPGRGLGFSGAARVAGALLGVVSAEQSAGESHGGAGQGDRRVVLTPALRRSALSIANELEGHPDNAAASMFGGVTAALSEVAVRVPMPVPLDVVVWWPKTETSTRKARMALPATVSFEDAVFNVAHSSVLVAAIAAGDLDAIGAAMRDRLHQERRLEMSPPSRAALDVLWSAGVVGAWLGGSGPTVAAFVRLGDGPRVCSALPASGTSRVLNIDLHGAVLGSAHV